MASPLSQSATGLEETDVSQKPSMGSKRFQLTGALTTELPPEPDNLKPQDPSIKHLRKDWPPTHWSSLRKTSAVLTTDARFDCFIGALVMINLIIVVIQTDLSVGGKHDAHPFIEGASTTLLLCFTLEAGLRLFAFRRAYFSSGWNVLDLGIILMDWTAEVIALLSEPLPSVASVRIIRLVRALRVLKTIRTVPIFRELYIMLHGFFSALRAIAWATVLLMVVLTLWSILAVEFIRPLSAQLAEEGVYGDCERCTRAFDSVSAATLTFIQQIVAGDSWGVLTVPIMEHFPGTIPIFMLTFITVELGLMNLILSVIVEKAREAQSEDLKFQVQQRQGQLMEARKEILLICEQIDEDESGCLSLEELERGWDSIPEFREHMTVLDLHKADMSTVFMVMDEDGSGSVAYDEFVDQLIRMKSRDANLVMVFMQYQLKEVRKNMEHHSSSMKDIMRDLQVLRSSSCLSVNLERNPEKPCNSDSALVSSRMIQTQPQEPKDPDQPRPDSSADGVLEELARWRAKVERDFAVLLEELDTSLSSLQPTGETKACNLEAAMHNTEKLCEDLDPQSRLARAAGHQTCRPRPGNSFAAPVSAMSAADVAPRMAELQGPGWAPPCCNVQVHRPVERLDAMSRSAVSHTDLVSRV